MITELENVQNARDEVLKDLELLNLLTSPGSLTSSRDVSGRLHELRELTEKVLRLHAEEYVRNVNSALDRLRR